MIIMVIVLYTFTTMVVCLRKLSSHNLLTVNTYTKQWIHKDKIYIRICDQKTFHFSSKNFIISSIYVLVELFIIDDLSWLI